VNVLVLGKYYYPRFGGMETYTQDVATFLAKTHRVTVLAFSNRNADREERGVNIRECKISCEIFSQPISMSLIWRMDLRPHDVIHFNAPNFWSAAVLLGKNYFSRKPVIITHHMDVHGRRIARKFVMPVYRMLVKHASAVIVTSLKNAAISRDLPAEAPITAIPLGVNLAAFAVSDEARRSAIEWRRNICGDTPVVGFVGRHARYKGLDVMLHALAMMPDVHALIAGDGPRRKNAEALAVSLGLAERVHFLGEISFEEKRRLLSSIDAFVFPSTETTEAFGIAQLEAMASGAPVVATDLPTGVTDVAIHESTALLAAPGDPATLAQAIARVLRDKELAGRLSANALARLGERFVQTAVLEKTRRVIEEAAHRGARVGERLQAETRSLADEPPTSEQWRRRA
jgi:rhamnosyl/mannosyltransferase